MEKNFKKNKMLKEQIEVPKIKIKKKPRIKIIFGKSTCGICASPS